MGEALVLSGGDEVPPLEINDTVFIFSIMEDDAMTKHNFVQLFHLTKQSQQLQKIKSDQIRPGLFC